jgi:biopolymer transport protein ExbD
MPGLRNTSETDPLRLKQRVGHPQLGCTKETYRLRVTPSGYRRGLGNAEGLLGVPIIRLNESWWERGVALMQSKRHRPNQLICGIDGTPFVLVSVLFFFVLLVFFLTRPTSFHGGVRPILPQADHPVNMGHANREDAMTVSIFRDDKVFFRNERVSPDQLPDRIRESIKQGAEGKVYIRADARAKYGWVAEVIDSVRSAGVEKIGFLVDQRRTPAASLQ